VAVGGAAVAGLSACGDNSVPQDADIISGKVLFVQKCGACHTLARANTTGKVGPNLDEAFREALKEGFGRAAVRGAIHHQILYPARLGKTSPVYMPSKLVTGKDADDVAAYVAEVVSRKGKDTGLLASAIKPAGAGKPVAAKNGVLQMPADPNGQLAYLSKQATAKAGKLEIESKNASSTDHDIAIEGNGVNEHGAIVKNGGVSKISVNLKPGTYTYFCTVQGHREGGMEGKLTVK